MQTVAECAQKGMSALENKDFDTAIAAFSQALTLEPGRPDMNHALGMAHMHRGDVGSAVDHLERAVELAEPYTHADNQALKREFHDALATAYQVNDRIDDALRILRGMVAQWPDQISPRLRLGQLLLACGRTDDGLRCYDGARELLSGDDQVAIDALIGALRAYLDAEEAQADVFLRAHHGSYVQYFDNIAGTQAELGWIAEAARMSRNAAGEVVPIVADGARPYALSRVDLVDPATGEASSIYSDQEPMIVAVEGLEPLAQVAVLLPWEGYPFDVLVSTQCPWHWLTITVVFDDEVDDETRVGWIDELMGDWYLAGYNGEYGDRDRGRFHYIADPEPLGARAVAYQVDLGRAHFDAIPALLNRLVVLHDAHRLTRVMFGDGRLLLP